MTASEPRGHHPQTALQPLPAPMPARLPWLPWLGAAIALAVLPLLLGQGAALSIATQTGVWIIFALAYNICLGETGMLSFCHALFLGIGAYAAGHAIQAIGAGRLPALPLPLVPLLGAAAGALLAAPIAWLLKRRTGVSFVMITLGLSQLTIYLTGSLKSVFGGEAGIAFDRAYDQGLFGPPWQVYALVAGWLLV